MTAHVGESAGEITNAQAHMQVDTDTDIVHPGTPDSVWNMQLYLRLKCM